MAFGRHETQLEEREDFALSTLRGSRCGMPSGPARPARPARPALWLAGSSGNRDADGGFKLWGSISFLFVVVWSVIGLAAFFMSVVCFTRAGSTGAQNLIGLFLALLLGPFYWLYYLGSGSYCKTGLNARR